MTGWVFCSLNGISAHPGKTVENQACSFLFLGEAGAECLLDCGRETAALSLPHAFRVSKDCQEARANCKCKSGSFAPAVRKRYAPIERNPAIHVAQGFP